MSPGGFTSDAAAQLGCRETTFDVLSTAGLYSALAGVLAGFAFAALVVLLTERLSGQGGLVGVAEPARVVTVAILGLVVSSLSYAVLAGGRISAGRAASEEVILGCGFVASAILLFYAIALLFDAAEKRAPEASSTERALEKAGKSLRAAFAFFAAPLAVAYLALGCDDYVQARPGDADWLTYVALAAIAVPLVAAAAGWMSRGRGLSEAQQDKAIQYFSGFAFGLILSAAVAFAVTETALVACDTAPVALLVIAVGVSDAFVGLSAWRFARDSSS